MAKAKVEIHPPAGAGHARQHDIINPLDHTSGATPGQVLQADANGLPVDATNTDAQVAAAVALAHAEDHHARHEPGGADPMAVNAAAATGSLRTVAGSGVALSAARSDHAHTLIPDNSASSVPGLAIGASATYYRYSRSISSGSYHSALFIITYAPGSHAFAVANSHGVASAVNSLKLQLFMAGIQVAESAYLGTGASYDDWTRLTAFRALSGSQPVQARIHNYAGSTRYFYTFSSAPYVSAGLAVAAGSVKL